MTDFAPRVTRSADLGRARRSLDLAFGSAAAVPLVAAAVGVWLVAPELALVLRTWAVIWAAGLLTFFAGVRRGLTFSEAGGGRATELATMFGLFALGMLAMVLCSAAIAAAGLAAVGVLDAVAGRRREAPGYFAAFRPWQMGLCALAMVAVQLRGA
jgi:hypothetical protein